MVKYLLPLDYRIPKWDFDNLMERNCPICDSQEANLVYERPDKLSVRHCNKCHEFFISPSPSDNQLREFYIGYDEKHRRAPKFHIEALMASYKDIAPFADIRIRELCSFMKFDSSKILDIGFGRAEFMYHLKKLGAIPFGIELDPKAIEVATSLGINTYEGNLLDFTTSTKYDLITLLDLLEHPLNPDHT